MPITFAYLGLSMVVNPSKAPSSLQRSSGGVPALQGVAKSRMLVLDAIGLYPFSESNFFIRMDVQLL